MGIALAWLFARMLTESEGKRGAARRARRADAAAARARRAPSSTLDAVPSHRRSTSPPRTVTSRPNVTSPSTAAASAARSDGAPAGKCASKSRRSL